MVTKENYKNLYFDLVIINRKLASLSRNEIVKEYIRTNNNALEDNCLVNRYKELKEEKCSLLCHLNDLYNEMDRNNIYYNSPLELLYAVYNKLKEKYPTIDKKTLDHYILVALYNMKMKDNYFDRQQSRIKRLNLDHLYNNWNYNIERK